MVQYAFLNLQWGIETNKGWDDIINRLLEDLEKIAPSGFMIVQIKEKFGELRVYTYNFNEETDKRIAEAVEEARNTCESCGATENLIWTQGWVRRACKECADKYEWKYKS